jgi:hypothetical protein
MTAPGLHYNPQFVTFLIFTWSYLLLSCCGYVCTNTHTHTCDSRSLAANVSTLQSSCRPRLSHRRVLSVRSLRTLQMTTEDLPCELPIRDATMHLVHGRRCLLIPSRKLEHRNTNLNTSYQSKEGNDIQPPPPIVILGGMAQCIESWQHHFQDFSRERDVLMYEYCGSGMQGPEVESLPEDVSI